jgi:NAD(P)H dehydrogenase (quinone)
VADRMRIACQEQGTRVGSVKKQPIPRSRGLLLSDQDAADRIVTRVKSAFQHTDGWTNEMKKAHIVHTHPKSTGLITEVARVAEHSLASAGWIIKTVDLMQEANFQEAVDTRSRPTETEVERNNVVDCDLLVLMFPMVWCSMPAALKQWVESIFCDQLVHGNTPANSRGCMRGKKAFVIAAYEEIECMQRTDSVEATMAALLRPLLEGTLNYLGFHVLRPLFINDLGRLEPQKTKEILDGVAQAFSQVESRPGFYGLLPPQPGPARLSMF